MDKSFLRVNHMVAFTDGKQEVEGETNLPWMEVKRNQLNFAQTLIAAWVSMTDYSPKEP